MKRLLCILSSMNAGGAETFLMKMYRKIDRTEYQMDFCINAPEKCFYEDEINSMGGYIYRIPPKTGNLKDFQTQLVQIVKEHKYKYVMRITSSAMGFMDLKIAKDAGASVCIARSSNASDGGGIRAFVAHHLGRLLYSKCVDIRIAPSDLAAIYTFGRKAYRKGDVKILYNAVDLNTFHFDGEARSQVRKEFGIADPVKVIGHIGRFMEQKNHEFLIDVFNEIYTMDSTAMLILVGVGPLEERIKAKVKALRLEESVVFAGVRSDIPYVLSAMDVVVLPSLFEGMPNVLIEAQACGLPCFVADTVTKQANVTGNVTYLPLKEKQKYWANKIIESTSCDRDAAVYKMKQNGYNVNDVAHEFCRLIFEEKRI